MDRLHAMTVFVTVADVGSFAAAARHLRLSPPAVTRAVASLEEHIGVRLLNRTTRNLMLTEAGTRYLVATRQILADIEECERTAAGEQGEAAGHLVITASVKFAQLHLMPVMSAFLDAHPKLTTNVICLDRIVNLIEDGIDVAIRIGELEDSTLHARRCGEVQRILVASPGYIEKHGQPQRPGELKSHDIIAFTGLSPNREWRFHGPGKPSTVRIAPRIEINDPGAALAAAEEGHGITRALSYMVADELRTGRLVPVLEAFNTAPVPVHLVFAGGRTLPAKTRSFIDFSVPLLQARLGHT